MMLRIICLSVFFSATGAVFNFNNFDKLNVKFYYGSDSRVFSQYHMANITQLLTNKHFDHNRPTTLYIFGWLQNPLGDTTRQLIDAYVQRGDYNFLVLDWSNYNVDLYTIVMFRMSKLSRVFGRSLLKLFNKGLSEKTFHCVGHSFGKFVKGFLLSKLYAAQRVRFQLSLARCVVAQKVWTTLAEWLEEKLMKFSSGAHSCGIIGREVQESSKGRFKLARITGLDPAKWKFFPAVYENPLGRTDATFVDTIQTDNFLVGAILPLGHASFYPNNAEPQPGCPPLRTNSFYNFLSSWCSHFNANRYWTESLKRSHTYPALKCSNWKDFKNGYCSHNPVNFMGLSASANITGVFYIELKTTQVFNHDELYYYTLSRIGERVIDVIVNELGIRL